MSNKLHLYEESNIEQLTLERNKLEAILMNIANGVVVCDKNDTVILLNDHAKQLLELQDDQLLNTNIKNYVDSDGNFCFVDKIEEYKKLGEKSSEQIIFNVKLDDKILKSIISPMELDIYIPNKNFEKLNEIQEKEGKDWITVGEFDDIKAAKRMVKDLRGGSIEVA